MSVPDEGYSRNTSTWWRLFREHVDLMKVIPGIRRPDEGYSRNTSTWWRLFQEHVDLMKVIPGIRRPMKVIPGTRRPDEGYSRNTSTWWRLFQEHVDLMKVIPGTRRAPWDLYIFVIVAIHIFGGLLISEVIICASALSWLIVYIFLKFAIPRRGNSKIYINLPRA